MKERPILFSAPMVCAILDGRKTQTRRVVSLKLLFGEGAHVNNCPYGKPGDRLWVRETWRGFRKTSFVYKTNILLEIVKVRVELLQDISEKDAIAEGISRVPFRPCDGWPICDGYMVGKDDGVTSLANKASKAYKKLWESLNGPGSWDLNPLVWVVEFKVLRTAWVDA